ncbi:hypothetical protein ACOSQ2_009877 [Xanthoceras sorbifolium]
MNSIKQSIFIPSLEHFHHSNKHRIQNPISENQANIHFQDFKNQITKFHKVQSKTHLPTKIRPPKFSNQTKTKIKNKKSNFLGHQYKGKNEQKIYLSATKSPYKNAHTMPNSESPKLMPRIQGAKSRKNISLSSS